MLRTFVRSSVEKILKEAPWTFNKVNPLKEACREFLREVDASGGAREHHGVGSEPVPETASVGERERESDERKRKSQVTRKLTLLATKALVAACDSGRPALAEPALGAAHKLVAMGFLEGTTNGSRARTVTDSEEKETAATDTDADEKTTTTTTDAETNSDVALLDDACVASVRSFCACASFFPDGTTGGGNAERNTTHVAAVGALLACAVSETFLLKGEALKDALSALLRVAVAASQPETRAAAKAATTQLINSAFRKARFDVRDSDTSSASDSSSDALLVLLTLCERASVPNSGEQKARDTEKARRLRNDLTSSSPSDPFAAMATALVGGQSISSLVASETRNARTRAVSLDLLRQLLEGPGSAAWLTRLAPRLRKPLRAALAAGVETEGTFASSEHSHTHHAANATGGGGSSRASAPAVARADPATLATASLARAAFTSLVLRARHAYKPEIARLYPRMALAPLEGGGGSSGFVTGSPTAKAKLAALRVIRALASDPQVLVDVFVNHDCDARGDNLYERTIGALASSMAPGGGDQQRFRDGAVQCVLAVVRSLRAWHARGADATNHEDAATNDDVAATMAIPPGGARPVSNGDSADEDESASAKAKAKAEANISTRSLSESETFASLKKRKASAEAATSAFNARPSVATLAAVMEISQKNVSEANAEEVDVADPGFPARAAAFLVGAGDTNGDANGDASGDANGDARSVSNAVSRRRRPFRRGTLDPSAVGELLGSHDVDALLVMKAYADAHDFAGLDFDEALRLFFRPFRVPGEAQKIDRLVERFAARHCECNPNHFEDSDQAYVLAFATVMLNTDAHNPRTDQTTKMSEEAFVAMAREGMVSSGQPAGAPTETASSRVTESDAKKSAKKYASDDALRALFQRVVAEEIEMSPGLHERRNFKGGGANDDDVYSDDEDEDDVYSASSVIAATVSGLAKQSSLDASRRRRDEALAAADKETRAVLLRTRELFEAGSGSGSGSSAGNTKPSPFFAASDPSLARPMLETAGPPLLRAVSRAFANADDAAHAALPLEGTRAIIVLASTLNLPLLRDGLCDFLARAPGVGQGLETKKSVERSVESGVGRHAVEAARTLLDLAAEASGLGEENWPVVLEVVSRMDALREAATTHASLADKTDAARLEDEREGGERGRIVDDLVARYASSDSEDETEKNATSFSDDVSRRNEQRRNEESVKRVAKLVACARAPLRFARGEASSSSSSSSASSTHTRNQKSAVSADAPITPTNAELALGTWLASAEGVTAARRVFENANRFDDVEATGFVAALAGVAVADAWAPAPARKTSSEHDGGNDPSTNHKNDTSLTLDPATASAVASMPFPSECPRAFAARRLAETTARALERPRAVRAEIWSARVAPVLAGMAAHPDEEIVRAAAEGLYVSAARFARRAEHGGSPAALAAAFAPFADAHRWATLAGYRVGETIRSADGSSVDLRASSRLARRLAAASAGLCVSALGDGKSAETPLTPCELAGWRAALSALKNFAGDPDESAALAALENATGAIVRAARRVVTSRTLAAPIPSTATAMTKTAKVAEDEEGVNDDAFAVSCERAFAEDASAALLAFAARRNREGEGTSASSSSCEERIGEKKNGKNASRGDASRAAAVCLRDVAVAAAEAIGGFNATDTDTDETSTSTLPSTSSVKGDSETPTLAPGEFLWRACVHALASAARGGGFAEDEGDKKPPCKKTPSPSTRDGLLEKSSDRKRVLRDSEVREDFSVFALKRLFDVLRDENCASRVSKTSFDDALSVTASASLDIDARVKATASAKETWETTTRNAAAWCVKRAPVAFREFVALVYRKKTRALALGASFPFHAHLPAMASSAVASADFALLDVVCSCCVELARALAATAAEDADDEIVKGSRERAWRGVVAAAEATATRGVAAAVASRLGSNASRATGKQSEVSSAGAYAATAACAAAAEITRFHREKGPEELVVPEETRLALLDVLARAHASAAKANGDALFDAENGLGVGRDAKNKNGRLNGDGDFLLRLETFAGSSLVEALRSEAEREDASFSAPLEARLAAADRLGATCAAILEGVVKIASPPQFALARDEDEDEEKDATDADDAWLAVAAARRDAGSSREPLAALCLQTLVSLKKTHAKVFFKRGGAATASAAALVAVARRPLCVAAADFFTALATSPSWSFEGTRLEKSEKSDVSSKTESDDDGGEEDDARDEREKSVDAVSSPRSEDDGGEEDVEGDERLCGGDEIRKDDAASTADDVSARRHRASRPPSHL